MPVLSSRRALSRCVSGGLAFVFCLTGIASVAGCGSAIQPDGRPGASGGGTAVAPTSVVAAENGLPTSVPRCSWPMRVQGRASADQIGLMRCYVKAMAQRNLLALIPLVDHDGSPTLTSSRVLKRWKDARTGTPTALFKTSADDPASTFVTVRYADGARVGLEMDIANPMSAHSWRLELGTFPQDGSAPPPAK